MHLFRKSSACAILKGNKINAANSQAAGKFLIMVTSKDLCSEGDKAKLLGLEAQRWKSAARFSGSAGLTCYACDWLRLNAVVDI